MGNRKPKAGATVARILPAALVIAAAGFALWHFRQQPSQPSALESHVGAGEYRAYVYGGLPKSTRTTSAFTLLQNKGYLAGYSERRKDPLWVAYRVFRVGRRAGVRRRNSPRRKPVCRA